MITKENGLRYAKLIHVSVDNGKTDNSNKVYIMEEQVVIVQFGEKVTEKEQIAFDEFREKVQAENPNAKVVGIGGGIKNPPIK